MRWGRRVVGPDHLTVEADRIYLFDVAPELPHDVVIGSLILHLDGNGVGNGEQRLRAAVMEADDPSTLRLGDEVLIADGQPDAWVHFLFDAPPRMRAGRTLLLGIASGASSGLVRLSVDLGSAGVSRRYAVPYGSVDVSDDAPIVPPDADGATWGSATWGDVWGGGEPAEPPDPGDDWVDVNALGSAVAVVVKPWRAPSALTDDELAALPVDVAQVEFAGSGVVALESAVCGWHYSNDDPPPPSSAVVRTGGPLEGLVGERVLVTTASRIGPASVAVAVVDELPFDVAIDEDISLSRDAFMRIGALWRDALTVRVEVLT